MNLKYDSLDHFSLIPYLGYFLLGSAIAFTCYKIKNIENELNYNYNNESNDNGRKIEVLGFLDKYKDNPIVKGMAWVGKRSMMFYIVHFTILYCIFKIIQINKSNIEVTIE